MVNIKKLMKQAQAMQEQMAKDMAALEVTGSAGGGVISVTMNGNKELKSVSIDAEVLSPDDQDMVQDLVLAAVNDAATKVDEAMQDKMGGMGAGMGLPGF